MAARKSPAPRAGGNRASEYVNGVDLSDNSRNRHEAQTHGLIATVQKNALGDELRIDLHEYNGHFLIGVRMWTTPRDGGEKIATKSGFAAKVTIIGDLIEALQKAQEEAERRGWL